MRTFQLLVALAVSVGILGCSQKDDKGTENSKPKDTGQSDTRDKDSGKSPIDKVAKMPKRDPVKEEKLAKERGKRVEQLAAQERELVPALAEAHPPGGIDGGVARLGRKFYLTQEPTFSSDGKLVAAIDDLDIHVWDLMTGKMWRKLTVKAPSTSIDAVRFGQDRQTLVVVTRHKDYYKTTISVWDVENQKELKSVTRDVGLRRIAISPDGKRLAVDKSRRDVDEHPVDVLDVDTLEVKYSLPAVRELQAIAFSPCGKFLATGGRKQVIL